MKQVSRQPLIAKKTAHKSRCASWALDNAGHGCKSGGISRGNRNGRVDEVLTCVMASLVGCDVDARRLFHCRGGVLQAWKHVAVDWYTPAVFVTLYEDKGTSEGLLAALDGISKADARVGCLAVQRRYLAGGPVEVLWGELPDRAHEAGMSYLLSLGENQNHGFFPDMQPGRA